MKKILQNLLCVILITVLFGCSTNFDRIKAMNEYAGMTLYAPNKRNIKEQVITAIDDDYDDDVDVTSATIIKADKKGRIIQIKNLADRLLDEINFDYDNLTFSQKIPALDIDVKNGTIILDNEGRLKEKQGPLGISVFHYIDDKIITSETKNFRSKHQNEFHWQGDLIDRIDSIMFHEDSSENRTIRKGEYLYDSENRLVYEKGTIKFIGSKLAGRTLMMMEDYNEYGDWIKARFIHRVDHRIDGYQYQEKKIITREITYW